MRQRLQPISAGLYMDTGWHSNQLPSEVSRCCRWMTTLWTPWRAASRAELQAELDGKLAALRRRAGALAAEDGPTRQVGQAAALYCQPPHQPPPPPPPPHRAIHANLCCTKAPQVLIKLVRWLLLSACKRPGSGGALLVSANKAT